jgi:hypothetical protein
VIRVWQGMYTVLNRQNIGPCLSNPNVVSVCARSQAIIQLRDALLLYAKHIGHFALNPNSLATRARSPAIMQLRDTLLLHTKHIDHCALNPNAVANRARSLRQSCIVRCNPLICETHEPFLSIPSQ